MFLILNKMYFESFLTPMCNGNDSFNLWKTPTAGGTNVLRYLFYLALPKEVNLLPVEV